MAFSETASTSLVLFFTLLLFLLRSATHDQPSTTTISGRSLLTPTTCSHILQIPRHQRCSFSIKHCPGDSNGILNYFSFHFCLFNQNPFLSIPFLSLIVMLQFYILVKTAQDQFSVVVAKLSNHLNLSPSMGAVTLLALGNGAPDVFASVSAVGGGHPRIGFGAILSAGTFVSAFVFGFVAIYASPFAVSPAPFIRDVLFYLTAALFLFYVYLSAEIFLWQAIGFVGLYMFFVGFVFWMDIGTDTREIRKLCDTEVVNCVGHNDEDHKGPHEIDHEKGETLGDINKQKMSIWILLVFHKIPKTWEFPVSLMLKLTIPRASPSEWNRFYRSANIALCPLALMYSCKMFVPLSHPVKFLLPNGQVPLWLIVLFGTSALAVVHFILEKKPPKTEQISVVLMGFVMSVLWISTMAGELLNSLAALGSLVKVPPALLGLTVLAWGNSVGDLVADVAVAKAGQPAMATAGCFAGPMFNMLFGLGTALVIQTANVYPKSYQLQFHVSIVVAFVFLLLSLMGSLLVVTWCRFRVPRFWGFCLVGLYVVFITLSLVIAEFQF